MIWTICFFLSLSILGLTLLISWLLYRTSRRGGGKIGIFYVIIGGVFLAIAPLFVPIYRGLLTDSAGVSWVKTILLSLHNAIRLFVIDADYSIVLDNLNSCPAALESAFSVYAAVMFFLAPILTFSFLLSFFRNAIAYLRLLCGYRREMYLFSELNEVSLTLASDLKKNHPHATIVFTDVFENDDEITTERIDRAKRIRAVFFKKDITSINFACHSKSAELYFFAIGQDESENLRQAIPLIERYGEREHSQLYVFSSSIEGELLLAGMRHTSMHVRRINEVQSLINRILYTDAAKIFRPEGKTELPPLPVGENGEKKITAVVVGMGRYGTAMLRALPWYCQMEGYSIDIHAFDRDPEAEERFAALCPELMSEKYNGVTVEGESAYRITVHSGLSTDTRRFAEEIAALREATYVFVSLGSDKDNVKCAVDLRMYFERNGAKPVIQAVLHNAEESEALRGVTNYRGQSYAIDFVGDLVSSYSEDVILDSELEKGALARHLKWGQEEEFWRYEYNYRSSIASAIHMKARQTVGLSFAFKAEGELTAEEQDRLEHLEHCRWNAYMRSEGYVYAGSSDKSARNDLGKMHHDLVVFDLLTEEEKRKDSSVGSC